MRDLDQLFAALRESSFRRKFRLGASERRYVTEKGMEVVMNHAGSFIESRLAPAFPTNDGKQTPFRGHPVFIAQHATGTCCRSCLEKWYGIKRGSALREAEKAHICEAIKRWLEAETI